MLKSSLQHDSNQLAPCYTSHIYLCSDCPVHVIVPQNNASGPLTEHSAQVCTPPLLVHIPCIHSHHSSGACSYVSAADLSGNPLIPRTALLPATARKPHTVYVIYYHTMPLQPLVAALQQYFQHHTRMGTDTYVWLDILAVDLTAPLDLSHATSAIAAASKVALIIDDNADVFSRAWCLFEVWWARYTHGHRGLPSTWLHVLPTGYQNDTMALVEALFAASFADAKCTAPADHAALLACVRAAPPAGRLSYRGDSHIAMTVVDTVWAVLLQHVQRAPHSTRGETAVDTMCMLSVRFRCTMPVLRVDVHAQPRGRCGCGNLSVRTHHNMLLQPVRGVHLLATRHSM